MQLNRRLIREILIVIVGVDPISRVTFGVFAAQQNIVAVFGPAIDADIAIGRHRRAVVILIAGRRGNVDYLLLKRPRRDRHVIECTGHLVNQR